MHLYLVLGFIQECCRLRICCRIGVICIVTEQVQCWWFSCRRTEAESHLVAFRCVVTIDIGLPARGFCSGRVGVEEQFTRQKHVGQMTRHASHQFSSCAYEHTY